ncbi:MAG: hypothetical protein ACTSYM_08980 [Candidatus Baldrarchaeia archaeon]
MFDYLLVTLSISLTGFSACILLNSGLKYRKVENATLYFGLYYLLGFIGLVDMTFWFLEIINSKIFAIVWFWLGVFTGAIGWTFLTQFMRSEKLKKIIKFYILFSITAILVLIAISGTNIIEAEILNTGTPPIVFSFVMKSYIIIGGTLMLLLMFTSAIKTKSKRISLFTACLLVWTIADYLLLNNHAFTLYLALYAAVSLLLLTSIKM